MPTIPLYVKVKLEEKDMTVLLEMRVPPKKNRMIQLHPVMKAIENGLQCKIGNRKIVCVDDEGDEVSECIIVVGRVSVVLL